MGGDADRPLERRIAAEVRDGGGAAVGGPAAVGGVSPLQADPDVGLEAAGWHGGSGGGRLPLGGGDVAGAGAGRGRDLHGRLSVTGTPRGGARPAGVSTGLRALPDSPRVSLGAHVRPRRRRDARRQGHSRPSLWARAVGKRLGGDSAQPLGCASPPPPPPPPRPPPPCTPLLARAEAVAQAVAKVVVQAVAKVVAQAVAQVVSQVVPQAVVKVVAKAVAKVVAKASRRRACRSGRRLRSLVEGPLLSPARRPGAVVALRAAVVRGLDVRRRIHARSDDEAHAGQHRST